MSTVQDRGTRSHHGSASNEDRRAAGNIRMPFEAIVEVGAHSVGGFEAESVNLSPEGIRLRTAYLPELGDTLVCRFDGFGGEVMAEGQVIWRKPEARGGEFGVQFTRLDEYAAQVLESMCAPEDEMDESEQPPSIRAALPGARVRVHIQGLGSPMRARVRDTGGGEVLIGSNLEFLRVGRDVELEDVEQGELKTAQIEHVDVAVDPETKIPQLIVALRCEGELYEAAPDSSELATAPIAVPVAGTAPARAPAEEREITPGPTVIDRSSTAEPPADEAYADEAGYTPAPDGDGGYTPYPPSEHPEGDYTPYSAQAEDGSMTPAPVSSRPAELLDDGVGAEAAPAGGSARLDSAKRRASALAGKVTPAFFAAGAGA
ncbi:MAG: PilZ domain-containing protein, partial [Deltaproteobacteria bacterium]|nr:PilZ domain-containing protein [Deltaproteobacteria bacterium]MBW2536688.1 PilZ domain-containing protein [Deltaproteobacteria bacterium]